MAGAGAHEQGAVDPSIARIPRFQPCLRAHVVGPRRHAFPPCDGSQNLRRTMAEAVVDDLDHRTIVRLHRIARVQFGKAIGEDRLPVGSQVQDTAVEARARHLSANDGYDPPLARTPRAHLHDGGEFDLQIADMNELRNRQDNGRAGGLGHGLSSGEVYIVNLINNISRRCFFLQDARDAAAREPEETRPMAGDGENSNGGAETAAVTAEPMDKLDQLIGYNLKRVYILVQNDFRQVLTDDDISPRMFSVLSMSVESAGITQSEVARQLGIERSGLVSIIDDMERRGLLNRMPVEGDRRAQALHPTEEGRAVYERALTAVFGHEERIFSVLSPEERAKLLELLMRVRRSVEGG